MPPSVMSPESASQKRAANFETVDFPLPDGPTKAVISPCFATKILLSELVPRYKKSKHP